MGEVGAAHRVSSASRRDVPEHASSDRAPHEQEVTGPPSNAAVEIGRVGRAAGGSLSHNRYPARLASAEARAFSVSRMNSSSSSVLKAE